MTTETISQKKCQRCGHEWFPHSPKEPIQCPICKSYLWDKPKGSEIRIFLQCHRCGYVWLRRGTDPPKACPDCKSRYWDKPKDSPKP